MFGDKSHVIPIRLTPRSRSRISEGFGLRELVRRSMRAGWLPYCVLIGLALAYTASHAHENEAFSPFDEYVYYDYVTKVPGPGIVRSGDEVGGDARNELSCRGVMNYGSFGESCDFGTHEQDRLYPYGGGTGADIYAPPYFALTWLLAQPFTWLGSDLVDASRWAGGVWLSAGLALTYTLLRAMRLSGPMSLGLSASLLSLPAVYWATQFISTDAPTMALSAALGLIAIATVRGRVRPWLMPLAAVIAVLFKVQNLAFVVLAALAVITWSARTASPGARWRIFARPPGITALASVVASVLAQVAWLLVRRTSAVASPTNVDTSMSTLTPRVFVDEAFKFLRSIGETGLDTSTWGAAWAGIFGLLGIGAIVAALVSRPDVVRWSVGVASAATAVTFGPALAVATTSLVGHYIPLPERYGVVLLVAVVLCIGWVLGETPVSRRLTAGLGLVVGVASVALV